MKRFRVTRDLDYVRCLGYGHLEDEFEAESKEELMGKLKNEDFNNAFTVVVDGYRVEDYGDPIGDYEIEEIVEE